jgi:hypothetical protein
MLRPSSRRRRIHRIFAAAGASTFVGFALGCMSLNIGSTTNETVSAELAAGLQRGKAHLRGGEENVVYYPKSYASIPNLEFDDEQSKKDFVIVEQTSDHFRVRNVSQSAHDLAWKARGTTASSPPTNVAQTTTPGVIPASSIQQP